jgi:hypothetical protein
MRYGTTEAVPVPPDVRSEILGLMQSGYHLSQILEDRAPAAVKHLDPTYRPQNLVEWAKRENVDPGQLQTSVRADDPSVSVPDP